MIRRGMNQTSTLAPGDFRSSQIARPGPNEPGLHALKKRGRSRLEWVCLPQGRWRTKTLAHKDPSLAFDK